MVEKHTLICDIENCNTEDNPYIFYSLEYGKVDEADEGYYYCSQDYKRIHICPKCFQKVRKLLPKEKEAKK